MLLDFGLSLGDLLALDLPDAVLSAPTTALLQLADIGLTLERLEIERHSSLVDVSFGDAEPRYVSGLASTTLYMVARYDRAATLGPTFEKLTGEVELFETFGDLQIVCRLLVASIKRLGDGGVEIAAKAIGPVTATKLPAVLPAGRCAMDLAG